MRASEPTGATRRRRAGGGLVVSQDPGYPHPSTPAASRVMRGNRKEDTRPEVRLRSKLHRRGLRFRKHYAIEASGVRVKPDIVFNGSRIAVFVDGCFWHGCADHGTQPKANSTYWSSKLTRNRERDQRVNESLRTAGWQVLRIWEHMSLDEAAARVIAVVRPGDMVDGHGS